ncbi:MAG: hypothetical protein ABJP45_10990 [Cyclobacteriaceae bacterium]
MNASKFFIGLICLLAYAATFAQSNQGGFLSPNDSLIKTYPYENVILIPSEPLVFYDAPNGAFAGRIFPGIPPNTPGTPPNLSKQDSMYYATIMGAVIRPQLLDWSYFFQTFDDRLHIPFDRQEKGFVRVLYGGFTGWISLEDLDAKRFKPIYWTEFYGAEGMVLTTPPNSTCALRASPYADAEVLVRLDEDHFETQVISFDDGRTTEGFFAKVRATHFNVHPCYDGSYEGDNVIDVYEGWIQLVDENGQPLVRHNPGGC